MQVILLEDIKGLGKKFDVKEIKDGYAKNFLIPRNLAKAANEANLKALAQQKAEWEQKEKETIESLKKIGSQLKDIVLDFSLKTGLPAQAGGTGKAFGSITASKIIKALKDLDILKNYSEETKNFEVALEKPIKELGDHLVEINLGKGIKSKIKIRALSQL